MKVSDRWTSTTDVAGVAGALAGARRVAVLTHAKPDGDAIGSTLSLVRAMRNRGVEAELLLVGPIAPWVAGVVGDTPFRTFRSGEDATLESGERLDPESLDADTLLVCDTGSWSQLAELRPLLEGRSERTIIIDHHLQGDADVADARLIDTSAAAAAEISAQVAVRLLDLSSAAELPREIAEPLYLGLATDTGWFKFSNVTPRTMRLAADLLEAGADHTRLYAEIEQCDEAARWRLVGLGLNSLELHEDESVAVMRLTLSDFAKAGAARTDTGGLADMVLRIHTVRVSAVLTEGEPNGQGPITKISLRSRPGADAVDVNEVARRLGGGGHARAAGARVNKGLDATQEALLASIREQIAATAGAGRG